jgi:prophage antirepressor-like protein
METSITVFMGKEIRKTTPKNEWWFSVSDVVEMLSDSADPKQYIKGNFPQDSGWRGA